MLNHRVEIIVPGTLGLDGKLTRAQHTRHVENTLAIFADLFGGATAQAAKGAYKSASGKLVIENVTRVWAYTDNVRPEILALVVNYATLLKETLQQESVAYVTDDTLQFV